MTHVSQKVLRFSHSIPNGGLWGHPAIRLKYFQPDVQIFTPSSGKVYTHILPPGQALRPVSHLVAHHHHSWATGAGMWAVVPTVRKGLCSLPSVTSQWVLSWTDGSVSSSPSLCSQGWPGTPGDPLAPVSSVMGTLAQPAAFGYNSTILSCFFFCNIHQALPLF